MNSTVASGVNNTLSVGKQVASRAQSSILLSCVEFEKGDNKCPFTTQNYHKYQQISGKSTGDNVFNGQLKGGCNMDQNKNQQVKHQVLVNGSLEKVQGHSQGDGVPTPRVQLCPPGKIYLEWRQVFKIGAGLANLGNTCFMNTVIQCLTYCPPLANYLLHDDDHASKCKIIGFCMMCELQKHMKRVLNRPGDVIRPVYIYQMLKSIAKHFQFGRQEDAHEFLRYVIDNLWKASLANHEGNVKLDAASKETTIINQIFGGYHRSQVICLRCKEKSNTYDHFMDFILDIKQNVPSLEKALEKFIHPELLQNDNAYKCPRCNVKVSAQKKFTVHRAPNVASFQFKRFDYNRMFGGKITKNVSYPEKLDLRPYMSDTKGGQVLYQLNAVLVHQGPSCNSGHYFCYVKNSNGFWYLMDDSRVQQVSLNQVLNQQAYVLFYVRVLSHTTTSTKKLGPSVIANHKNTDSSKNGHIGHSGRESPAISVTRSCQSLKSSPMPGAIRLSSSSTANIPNGVPHSLSWKPSPLPLAPNREKVAFDLRRSLVIGDSKEKIVNGNFQTRANLSSKNNSNGLVPYAGDSSGSSDDESTENTSTKKMCVARDHDAKSDIKSIDQGLQKSETNKVTQNDLCESETNVKDLNPPCNLESQDISLTKQKDKQANKISEQTCPRALPSAGSTSRSEIVGLSATPPTKLKATWHVADASSHSPSIASGSSTNSVNSTTDWTVTDQESLCRMKTERVYPGWTVITAPTTNTCSTSDDKSKSLSNSEMKDNANVESNEASTSENVGIVHSLDNKLSGNDNKPSVKEESKTDSPFQDNDQLNSVDSHKNTDISTNCDQKMSNSRGSDDNQIEEPKSFPFVDKIFSLSQTATSENSFLKSDKCEESSREKHSKRETDKNAIKGKLSNVHQGSGEKWEPQLFDHGENSNNSMSKKRKRKDHEEEGKRDGRVKKKKKHKHHNQKHKDKDHKLKDQKLNYKCEGQKDIARDEAVSQSNSEHKNSSKCADISRTDLLGTLTAQKTSEQLNFKYETEDSESDSSSSSFEYEWVEKTKETVEAERNLSDEVPRVSSKHWSKETLDGHKNLSNSNQYRNHSNDNMKYDTVSELLKMSGQGFGGKVLSWDGRKSHLDREIQKENHKNSFHYEDNYDDEYDKGKVKKVKHRYSDSGVHYYNPFQKVQNFKSSGNSHSSHQNLNRYHRYDSHYQNNRYHQRWKPEKHNYSYRR